MKKINILLLAVFAGLFCLPADSAESDTVSGTEKEQHFAGELLKKQKIRVKEIIPVAVARLAAYEKRGAKIGVIGVYKSFSTEISGSIAEEYGNNRYVELKIDGMSSAALPFLMDIRTNAAQVERIAALKEDDRILIVGKIKVLRIKPEKKGKETLRIPVFELEDIFKLPPLPEEESETDEEFGGSADDVSDSAAESEQTVSAEEENKTVTETEKPAKSAEEKEKSIEEDEWI